MKKLVVVSFVLMTLAMTSFADAVSSGEQQAPPAALVPAGATHNAGQAAVTTQAPAQQQSSPVATGGYVRKAGPCDVSDSPSLGSGLSGLSGSSY